MQFDRSKEINEWKRSLKSQIEEFDEEIRELRYEHQVLKMKYEIYHELYNELSGDLLSETSRMLGEYDEDIAILLAKKKELYTILDHLDMK